MNARIFLPGIAVTTLLGACDPDPSGDTGGDTGATVEPSTGPSLRVATWNTALMSLTFNAPIPPPPPLPSSITYNIFAEKFNESYFDRANAIADGILASDQDVIALNEVFSDEARQILVDRLSVEYPHYVAKIQAFAPLDVAGGVLPDWLPLPPLPVADYLVDPLDSGLMVFSRFPLLTLDTEWNDADCFDSACQYWGQNNGSDLDANEFAFRTYDTCNDFDCFSSKGIGLVKIDAPQGETYVAFTHMQADVDHDEQFAGERSNQYAQISEFLDEVVGPSDLQDARVVLVGDLNTPGRGAAQGVPGAEWQSVFGATGSPGFFGCGNNGPCTDPTVLTDAAGFETSPNDPSLSVGENRLDYALHNSEDGALCMQHVMIGYDAAENGVDWHSDHRMVRVDLNDSALWCSPNIAAWDLDQRPRELQFGEESCDSDAATAPPPCHQNEIVTPSAGASITHPGSFQWFRIEQAGSYVMMTSDADPNVDVAFDVYDSRDLSRALQPVDEDVSIPIVGAVYEGDQYLLSSPPYYIRTYATSNGAPDREAAGIPYTFVAHQNLCRAPNDACLIEPNQVEDYNWPDQSASTLSVSDVWFKFRTSGVKDGVVWPGDSNQPDPPRFPTEQFIHETASATFACLQNPVIEQYSTDGLFTLIDSPAWAETEGGGQFDDLDGDGLPDGLFTAPELAGDTFGELKFYFAHVSRTCAEQAVTFLEQRTTLTYFEPHRVTGRLQYDESGVGEDDLIRFLFTFDADSSGSSPPCEGACQHHFVFDEPNLPHQSADYTYLDGFPAMQGYYVDYFYPNLYEDENGPDFLLNVAFYNRDDVAQLWLAGGLRPLPSELASGSGVIFFANSSIIESAAYWYELEYDQRRRR